MTDVRATTDPTEVGDRIEQLLDELKADAPPATYDKAEELLRLVTDLYGAGLARVMELAAGCEPRLADELVADDLVASLLLAHGLHPASLVGQLGQALARVRPVPEAGNGCGHTPAPSEPVPVSVVIKPMSGVPASEPRAGERCELCRQPIPEEHGHLVSLEERGLICACRGCYLLFTPDGAGGHRFRAVPDRYLALTDVELTPAQWDALQIPVSVAFFFLNSTLERVAAFYPGPAGATESLLPLATWDDLASAHPVLATLQPDVEALLIRSARGSTPQCYLVPIDACYELSGRLRQVWRGFDGGREAHATLDEFFARIEERTR